MIYYLTGREKNSEIKVEFSGECGHNVTADGVISKSIYTRGLIPLASINYELVEQSGYLFLRVNYSGGTITLSINVSNNILSISGYIKVTFTSQEVIWLDDLTYEYVDEVGNIDYPLPQRMNIREKIKDYITIEANLNGNSQSASVYDPQFIINNYNAYTNANSGVSVLLNPSANVNLSLQNNFSVRTTHNGTHFYPNTLQDSESRTFNANGLTVTQTSSINSSNGLIQSTTLQLSGTVPAEENEFGVNCSYEGTHSPLKKAHLILKAYNLNKPNDDEIDISVFGDNFKLRHSTTKDYAQIYKYSYSYFLITRGGNFYYQNPDYDVAKISSLYRFLFRTFIYNAINSLNFNDEMACGNILDENAYQVIRDGRVQIVGNDVQIIVYYEGGGLFPQSENPNFSVVRYYPNNGDYLYLDSYRYLRLRLKQYISNDVTLKLIINNKEYVVNVSGLNTTNPTDVYIDLCNPSNATQTIDDKNNNFDEDDSYANYWGITKTRYIDFYYNYSFVLSGLDLCKKRPDLNIGEEKITILPQRSTWQEGFRRNVVARFYGKQNLELSDANTVTGERTLDDLANDINSNRWYGWQCTKENYDLSSCSGVFRNLRPCLLNLYTSASFLCGAGNLYDGVYNTDYNYVNINFQNGMQLKAQFLVDEISFYPDCGDVFWNTSSGGAIILYASLIKRAQANGLIFVYNEQVTMYSDSHYAGNDLSDEYGYYYIVGEYAKSGVYNVEYIIRHLLNCRNANEYRVCFKPVTQELILNDINYENLLFSATVNIKNEKSFVCLFDNNFQNFVKKDVDCSSCDINKQLIVTAGSELTAYSYRLLTNTKLTDLGNYMYPFVKVYDNEIYVTYYDAQNKNFVFELYNSKYELKNRYTNIINSVPSGGEIIEQNFPFDITGGLIVGIFVYKIGSNKYLQVVHSIDGNKWYKVMEEAI